jgi:hypothetical protein
MISTRNLITLLILSITVGPTAHSVPQHDPRSAAAIVEKTIHALGIEAARTRFRQLRVQQDKYSLSEAEFIALGSELRRQGKIRESIAVFKMATEAFSASDRAYLELGRAYRFLGLDAADLENTSRAFEIRESRLLEDFISGNAASLARNAQEVIDRYLDAIGGQDKISQVKTVKMTLTELNAIDQEVAFIRYYAHPHLYRQTIVETGHSTVTDGKKVWRVTGEDWEESPHSNALYAPDIHGDFIDYEEKGITYELLGVEVLDSQVLYCLVKTYRDGHRREYYFSPESGLFVMERRDFGIGKDVKRYYDWREVEGVLYPHVFVVTNRLGLGNAHGAIVKELVINEPLDASLFTRQEEPDSEIPATSEEPRR